MATSDKHLNINEISEKNIDAKVVSNTEKRKRTIKNISVATSKKETSLDEKNITKPKATKQKPTKKTLHLKLDDIVPKEVKTVTPSFSHVIDTSINQNSPFFSEPSVFEKLNINIINVDNEDASKESEKIESTNPVSDFNTNNSIFKSFTFDDKTNSNDLAMNNFLKDPKSLDTFYQKPNLIAHTNEINLDKFDDIDKESLYKSTKTLEVPNDDDFSIESYFGINYLYDENNTNSFNTSTAEDDAFFSEEDTDFEDSLVEENDFEDSLIEIIDSEEENIEEIEKPKAKKESKKKKKNEDIEEENVENNPSETVDFSKLVENFNKTLVALSDRIASLEAEKAKLIEVQQEEIENTKKAMESTIEKKIELLVKEKTENKKEIESNNEPQNKIEEKIEDIPQESPVVVESTLKEEIISDNDFINELLASADLEEEIENVLESDVEETLEEQEVPEAEELSSDDFINELLSANEIDITSQPIQEETNEEYDDIEINEENLDEDLTDSLLDDILLENIYQDDLKNSNFNLEANTKKAEVKEEKNKFKYDFSSIINSLTKTISDLENSNDFEEEKLPEVVEEPKEEVPEEHEEPIKEEPKIEVEEKKLDNTTSPVDSGKSINILIDKDDIFSISILNETYEIVADFDGISVISESIHISTPKNNFFVEVGNKYIEIHRRQDEFLVNTNFEDVEFANAINNIAFAKKKNKIELNVKEAFKLSSAQNKVILSMLNTSIANMNPQSSSEDVDENSICDNRTLLISEETQKVYLPYTLEEVMKKLNESAEYQTPKEIVENEYTLPLSTFKQPIISRFKEAYKFMRTKEKSSRYAAIDLGLELMFNSDLNPAVIRACKDLKELNIYLDCLYENEVDKFDCFKIIYKILPKIK